MSQQKIKKFRKNDFREEEVDNSRPTEDKRKVRRVERALRTKDISILIDEDDEEEEIDPRMFDSDFN